MASASPRRWRQGGKVPHHIFEQRGRIPDRRPWPDGDPPIGFFTDPVHARLAVEAVNALIDANEAPS
jgi:hypothetical protein